MSTQTDTVRYELMVIVSPEIGETAIKKRLDAIKKSLTDAGGEIFFEDIWGLRNLAYNIRKQDQGFYAVLDVNLDPDKVKELERMLRLETEVLRHLIMKLPSVYQPQTQAQMEAELLEKMPEEEKKEKPSRNAVRPSFKKPAETPVEAAPKAEVKEEKPAKASKKAEETKEEAAPKKAPKKKEEDKKALEDIDAKLDSILSNPDINF